MGETQTWDEGIHISAGYSYLTFGDYSWNMEHPPLVKMVSALPLLFLGLESQRTVRTASVRTRSGTESISCTRTGSHADSILIAARASQHSADPAVRPGRGVVDAAALRSGGRTAGRRPVRLRPQPDRARPLRDHRFPGDGVLLFRLRAVGGIPGASGRSGACWRPRPRSRWRWSRSSPRCCCFRRWLILYAACWIRRPRGVPHPPAAAVRGGGRAIGSS